MLQNGRGGGAYSLNRALMQLLANFLYFVNLQACFKVLLALLVRCVT